MSHRDWDQSCKVYIGNLGQNGTKHEIEASFTKYGPLKNTWIARNPPGFAFVEFEDPRDAEDAVRGLDGTRICGVRVRVEMSSNRPRGGRDGRGGGGGGDRRGGGGGGGGGGYNRGPPRYNDRYNDRSRSRSPKRRAPPSRSRSRSYSPRQRRTSHS
ncbi:serine/arginine-rich splicing factor 3-like isoform X1 [Acyrthosiphon pisum]|uniref:RRM domain-containing protein n=1 Tax=Acyrthosiphon pisum TaxID=7029 RepID=A0A8R1X2M0_ACYPI|nr:serine/arginine-rich splicing factor 3-like isoform X1 [Acyrthosiphon pisum]XP_026816008.1 RNA-binding protein 1-like isoform X1 [Rhopalosiphum maidis]XP_060851399.1 RNA-binding protein 1 isoform X1 [Rhopalosiphum padi]|eukprot:XP_008178320.1 PREDICTED: serine/arginine-rich splicing factor 3-like isoform X1 [Acyrthosiphon pisum]